MPLRLYGYSLAVAVLVAARGYRSGSLNKSGAAAAALLGYSALANPLSVFGVCLLGFYLAGSRATRVKAAIKATYEEPDHAPQPSTQQTPAPSKSAPSAKTGGNRSAAQVACNALLGTSCALAWRYLYSGESVTTAGWSEEGRWCVTARGSEGRKESSRVLVLAAVAFWAACCGDTFASELGILSSGPPILITTLRPCPRGTNGGISAWGTLVSLLGGLFVGVLALISLALQGQATACAVGAEGVAGLRWAAELLALGAVSGFGGSLIDSLLGGIFQPTYYSKTRSLVVHSPIPSAAHPEDEIVRVPGSGWDVLSNNAVNALSTLLTAGGAACYASRN
ncbi:hypothetical protein JCM10908_006820 [Rhodotorula pacifica]|uniref:DUF92 domain-containing protein n=1 Tax=Rhodotorula pacifica TaxID=1495444 RepID=UPI00317D74D7